MPLIDLKSELSLKRQVGVIGNSGLAVAESHADRLLELLTSSKGLEFAAKQAILDPTTAARRLAAIAKQISVGFGIPGVGYNGSGNFRSVYPTPARQVEAEKEKRNSVESKYYVKSPIDRQRYIGSDYDELRDLDIVPFYFTILETEMGEVRPMYHLAFRSFFSSISDSTSAAYSSYNFIGRGENFHTYQNYTRTSNFSFKVAAFSREELNILHDKVVNLRKLAAPKYRGGYMQGNYINLTIGNYFKNMPGFITSVNVNIAENFNWEIEDRSYIMPHVMDITVGYTILESATPNLPYIDPNPIKLNAKTPPRLDTAPGATQLAPTFAPPVPEDFTTDFSRTADTFAGQSIGDIFNF